MSAGGAGRSWGVLAGAAVVVLAALADLWVGVRPNGAPTSLDAMHAAAAALKAYAKPGDLLVHSPLFTVAELSALGDLRISPAVPSKKLMASRRVVVLDRRDHEMYGFGRAKEVVPLPDGALELRVFEPSGPVEASLYVLRDSLTSRTMRVERPIGTVESRCTEPRADGGFQCPKEPDWLYTQARTLRIGGEDSSCVWAHPTTGDGAIVLEIPAQAPPPAGRRLQLVVSAGMVDDAVNQTPDGASVTTAVVQDGRERGRVVAPNRIGWQRGTFSIDPGQPIELRVTTPRDGRRHHCLNAEVIDVADGAKKEQP